MEEITIVISIIAFCLFVIMITFMISTINQITFNTKLEDLNEKLVEETIIKIDTFKSEIYTIKDSIATINDTELKFVNVVNSLHNRISKIENRYNKKKRDNNVSSTAEITNEIKPEVKD